MNKTEYYADIYSYKLNDVKSTLEEYKSIASRFLAYIKKLKPKADLRQCGAALIEYQYNWYLLIDDILTTYNHKPRTIKTSDEKYRLTYPQMIKKLNLVYEDIQDHEYYKNIWGPTYWRFLHSTSILCKTNSHKNRFSSNMLNFNLCLICGECAYNFTKKEPFILMMVMTLFDDVITPIFNLHNKVNQALKKPIYNFEDFQKNYNITATFVKSSDLIYYD
ncbi:Ac92-like protein [Aratus pisonii nudivirus]|nr:Ac92-like protein [Aratus pisonii nudivirus]